MGGFSPLLDGGGLQFHATAGGAVGLGQDQGNLKTGGVQSFDSDSGELRGTGKNDAHGA
jgi:hypothetical protein